MRNTIVKSEVRETLGFPLILNQNLFSILDSKDIIGLDEFNTILHGVLEQAIQSIKSYFVKRALEEGQSQIRKWKSEDVCPFKADATSPVEIAERQVFDIVAVKLAENMPSLDQSDKKTGSGKFSSDRGNRVIAQTSPSFRQEVPESADAREGKSRGIRTIIGPLGGLLSLDNQSLPENKVVSASDTQACCRD